MLSFQLMIKKYLSYIIFLFCGSPLLSQSIPGEHLQHIEKIANQLEVEGFQSISINYIERGYVIAYENRRYRFEPTALKQIIELTKKVIDGTKMIDEVTFIPKRNNIPMLSINVPVINTKLELEAINKELYTITQDVSIINKGQTVVRNQNTGNYKAELVLRPYFSGEYGNPYTGDPITHLFDIRPKINLYLWKGAHFTYEFIIPISNEFKSVAPHWSEVRNRIISLSQQFRLPQNIFLNASIGVFSRNRYGISTEIAKYFGSTNFFMTGKVGYTGHASYVRYNGREVQKGWIYTDLNYIDYKLGLNYWMPSTNTQFSLEYGKVLNDRKAIFFECKQRFREINLGFFVFKTDEGNNYGMNLAIPIMPKKYWKPKRFSVRPARHWTYQYLSEINLAREYQAQGMFYDFPQDLNPHFIKNYIKN